MLMQSEKNALVPGGTESELGRLTRELRAEAERVCTASIELSKRLELLMDCSPEAKTPPPPQLTMGAKSAVGVELDSIRCRLEETTARLGYIFERLAV